jgi:cell division protein FtsQ
MTTLAMERDLADEPEQEQVRSRSLGWVVLVSLLLPAAFLLLPYADGSPAFRELQVDGRFERVGADEVRAALASSLKQDFWNVDLAQARAAIETLPWVARARVERQWPGTLRVRIWERTAFARWSDGRAIDTEARLFAPATSQIDATLPRLDGVGGQEREVLGTFQRLQEKLRGTAFELVELRQDARGEWFGRSATGIDLHLGAGAPDERLGLLTGPVLEALKNRLWEVDYVDLRYTNGFAVNWRPHTAEGERHG